MTVLVFPLLLVLMFVAIVKLPVVVRTAGDNGPVRVIETFSPFRARFRRRFAVSNPEYKHADLDAFDLDTGENAKLSDWYAINKFRKQEFEQQERQKRLDSVKGKLP